MVYKEIKRDLFDVRGYIPAHCISIDCKMGAGIAVAMRKKYKLGGLYKIVGNRKHPITIYHNGVYNLITKAKYWNKPTYDSITKCIEQLRDNAIENEHMKLVMPKIGSGLDRLSWPKVREIIQDTFKNTDIEILVCYI